jgi:hypothetical protein
MVVLAACIVNKQGKGTRRPLAIRLLACPPV